MLFPLRCCCWCRRGCCKSCCLEQRQQQQWETRLIQHAPLSQPQHHRIGYNRPSKEQQRRITMKTTHSVHNHCAAAVRSAFGPHGHERQPYEKQLEHQPFHLVYAHQFNRPFGGPTFMLLFVLVWLWLLLLQRRGRQLQWPVANSEAKKLSLSLLLAVTVLLQMLVEIIVRGGKENNYADQSGIFIA